MRSSAILNLAAGFDAMQALPPINSDRKRFYRKRCDGCRRSRRAISGGARIPQDMAVIGYDDIELARYMTPPLTTIHQPKDEFGRELAIDVLIHRMAQPALQQQRLQLTRFYFAWVGLDLCRS